MDSEGVRDSNAMRDRPPPITARQLAEAREELARVYRADITLERIEALLCRAADRSTGELAEVHAAIAEALEAQGG